MNDALAKAVELPRALDTVRLTLRPFRFEDLDDVVEYANDEEWSRYLLEPPYPYEREHAVEFLARQALADWAVRPTWAISLRDRAVGAIGLRFRCEQRVADAGWAIGRAHWNRGFMTEAARAVVDTAFRALPRLGRVSASADVRNAASLRVMEKIGMRREGTFRRVRYHPAS